MQASKKRKSEKVGNQKMQEIEQSRNSGKVGNQKKQENKNVGKLKK